MLTVPKAAWDTCGASIEQGPPSFNASGGMLSTPIGALAFFS